MREAALRIAQALAEARKGGFYEHGWYSYIDRHDVEALLLAHLSPTERAVYRKAVA